MNKILLVEDEKELAKAIKAILTFNNYNVSVEFNGKSALNIVQRDNFDLIIMDVMMPVMNGIEAVKEMRKAEINTPVILLTAKSQVDDKVEGLDAGANDYITKPFSKKELLARIRALLRNEENKKEKYNIGNIYFYKETSELSNNKTTFLLNDKESKIIEILVKNQKRVVTVKELENRLWRNEEKIANAIPMYISYLQDKFKALEANVFINDKNGYILESIL